MATIKVPNTTVFALLFSTLLLFSLHSSEAQIGVSYGRLGNNLPSEQQVVNLYKSNGIQLMRLYWPSQATLQALQGSGIQLLLDVENEHIQNIAQDSSQATQWIQKNVVPYASSIRYLAVGNEVPQSVRQYVGPAMWNIQNALNAANIGGQIKVTTTIGMGFLKNTYPPSSGEFTDLPFMDPIINFLTSHNSPLLVNIYPYLAYINDKTDIKLEYALFTSQGTVVTDLNNQLQYQNLFDAMVDSVYAALSKRGASNTPIVVSESGWPSSGGDSATSDNAVTYYKNLISQAGRGTPRKPGQLEIYLFAMFDENQKQGSESEHHYGLFYPNQQPKYSQLSFGPQPTITTGVEIGVCYGGSGDNLPSEQQVVNLYKANGIKKMRIYWPNPAVLQAVQGSEIQVLVDVPNEKLQALAQDQSQATQWVQTNVVPYASNIRYLSVGNEVPQSVRQYVGPAMWNVQNALNSANIGGQIKVSTAIGMSLIKNSYPPSAGEFTDLPFMDPILNFLTSHDSPLMVNIYPYFMYANSNAGTLDFALGTSPGPVFTDPNNGLQYQNSFDALADSVYAALAKRNAPHTKVNPTEYGWPSGGGQHHGKRRNDDAESINNAGIAYRTIISHARKGTPLKPGPFDIYLFALFDEDQKPGAEIERHFGLFTPDQQPKYGRLEFS